MFTKDCEGNQYVCLSNIIGVHSVDLGIYRSKAVEGLRPVLP